MTRFFSALIIWTMALCLPASAKIAGCYQVFYDAAVLKRNPKMEVTAVTLLVGVPPNDQEDFSDFVQFTLRSKKTGLGSAKCSGTASKQACRFIDFADGTKGGRGRFVLTETKDGVALSPVSDLSLWVDQRKTYKLQVTGNSAHKVFTLKKTNIDLERCGGD
jgi:hypothetical protein